MVKVNKAEEKLIREISGFQKEMREKLKDIKYGINFAAAVLKQKGVNSISEPFERLYEILCNFDISSYSGGEEEVIAVNCTINKENYNYTSGKKMELLTDKQFVYLLMCWIFEINNCLMHIEEKCGEDRFDSLCRGIKYKLKYIINDYINL